MPLEIKTPDYQGGNRRNGSKLKLSVGDYIKLIVIIFGVTATAIAGWVKLNINTQALAIDTKENRTGLVSLEEENDVQDMQITEIRTDIKHIKESTEEVQETQVQQTQLLYRILGKLDD